MRWGGWTWVAWALVIIGGLNWGFIGLFHFDLVAAIFGPMTAMSRVIYTLIGLGALWQLIAVLAGNERRIS